MYHFVGIGGIGMSALARILLQKGEQVRGSDSKESALVTLLREEGAEIEIGHRAEWVMPHATVVYSTSIDPSNPELQRGARCLHRSEMLHHLMQGQKPLLVTGTHGKTTTTGLVVSILLEAGCDPSFVVGGILRREKTNGRFGSGPFFVAEADESDGSFLRTPAYGAIVTNVDLDHLDYWKTEERLREAFETFAQNVSGPLLWCRDACPNFPGTSYGFSKEADLRITDYEETEEGISFSLGSLQHLELRLLGRHNALNAAAAVGLALSLGIGEEAIRKGLLRFQGTERRLELKGVVRGVRVYDDYGHHPTEIKATLTALRSHIRERRLIVLFQPHRYTRTRDLWREFQQSFQEADLIILTDLYGAGEMPLEGITSQRLAEEMGARFISKHQIVTDLASLLRPHDVVLTIGAGDITSVGPELLRCSPVKLKVALLSGGASPEHSISLLSAAWVQEHLNSDLYELSTYCIPRNGEFNPMPLQEADVVIPILHGPFGEDGRIAALCDVLKVATTGCDYTSGAIAMHKGLTKRLALAAGVDTARFLEFREEDWKRKGDKVKELVEAELVFPVWVKAVHLGSSLGVTRVSNLSDFDNAVEEALRYDTTFIVEEEVEGRQIEFSVLGNEFLKVGEPGEILTHGTFYSFDAKYGPNATEAVTPADLPPALAREGKELAKRVFRALGCQGMSRVDFFLTPKGEYLLNEVNPIPGMTRNSLYPKMLMQAGMKAHEIVDAFIWLALYRRRQLNRFFA